MLALGGLYVSSTLAISHFWALTVPCGTLSGCDVVAGDPSSEFFGLPVALYGVLAYLVLAVCTAARLGAAKRGIWLDLPRAVAGLGTIISLALTYHAIHDLGATCAWCVASAFLMIFSFVVHDCIAHAKPSGTNATAWELALGVLAVVTAGFATFLTVGRMREAASETIMDRLALSAIPIDRLLPEASHIKGDLRAPVTILEFADLTCPACRTTFAVLERLVANSRGNFRLAFRHFPLVGKKGHELALPLAAMSEMAAAEGKFWPFVSGIYEGEGRVVRASEVAKSLGLDSDSMVKRLKNPKDPSFARVEEDRTLALRLKLHQTPTIVVIAPGVRPEPATLETLPSVLSLPKFVQFTHG